MVPEDERGVSACVCRVRLSGTTRDQAPANQSQRAQSQLLLDTLECAVLLADFTFAPLARPPTLVDGQRTSASPRRCRGGVA